MSYECSNCCKEIEDEFLVVQENHVILALFNDVEIASVVSNVSTIS